jgi:hypothetical protein
MSGALLIQALAFYDVGCCVIPAAVTGTKQPWPDGPSWDRYKSERPPREQLAGWFGEGRYDGFGLVCGAISGGLEMLEFEGRAIHEEQLAAYQNALDDHGLMGLWKRIVNGYMEATPSGGMHVLYRVRGTALPNTKLARRPATDAELAQKPGDKVRVLMETRGEGGFTVVAPSGGRTHETGRSWQLGAGGPASIAVIEDEERNALYAVASLLSREPPRFQQPGGQGGGRPGDDYAARKTWEQILTPHGWKLVSSSGNGAHSWRRPGKEQGISATTRDDGGLYVFSTSTEFDAEVPYSKFGAYAVLEHGGDHSAAAAQLYRDGYGEQKHPITARQDAPEDETSHASGGEAWETPVPLGVTAALPPFPADAFPLWLRAEVEAVAEFTQTPPDLPGTVALGVLATAGGGRAVVEVRGSWREPVNLFTVSALPPGSRKSAVFVAMTQPLLDTEQGLVERVGPQIIEATTMRTVAQRDAEKRARTAAGLDKGEERDRAMADAIDAAQLAEGIAVPVMPRLIADDITPEAAASLLAEQGGRLAVLSAEGGIFATLAGRYSGGTPQIEVFLKGHSGDLLRVDRKGRPPEHIARPALTLGLCVQPDVLRAIADMPGFRGRGLLARILYSVPVNLVGRRKVGADPVPEDVHAAYAANVRTLVLTFAEWTDPAVLTLTPEAAALLLAAEQQLEPRLAPDTGDLAGIVDWASKLIGATARIAALLHIAEHYADGWGKPISEATMRNALQLADYFTAHALAAFDHMGVDPVLAAARELFAWVERSRPARFTKREMFSGVSRSRFPKVGDLDAPLDLIEQHGWIRREAEPERTGPGRRPSPAYQVHPELAAETAVSAQRPVSGGSADYAVSAGRAGGDR